VDRNGFRVSDSDDIRLAACSTAVCRIYLCGKLINCFINVFRWLKLDIKYCFSCVRIWLKVSQFIYTFKREHLKLILGLSEKYVIQLPGTCLTVSCTSQVPIVDIRFFFWHKNHKVFTIHWASIVCPILCWLRERNTRILCCLRLASA